MYEPKDEKACESCRHWKYIAREWQCETTKCQGYTPKTEPNSSEKPNNCEPKICDTCRYYNSNIPCGSTPSACKEADKFAEEFVDGLKKLKPKDEPQTEQNDYHRSRKVCTLELFDDDGVYIEPQTDCAWK